MTLRSLHGACLPPGELTELLLPEVDDVFLISRCKTRAAVELHRESKHREDVYGEVLAKLRKFLSFTTLLHVF